MTKKEIKLLNVFYDVNVPPSKITKILDNLKEGSMGTFLAETLLMRNAGILLILQIEFYQHAAMRKNL